MVILLYLVITEEKNGQRRHTVNSYEKATLLKLVDNIPRGYFITHCEYLSVLEGCSSSQKMCRKKKRNSNGKSITL